MPDLDDAQKNLKLHTEVALSVIASTDAVSAMIIVHEDRPIVTTIFKDAAGVETHIQTSKLGGGEGRSLMAEKHECWCSFCGDKFEGEDAKEHKCPTCTHRRQLGTFPDDRYPTESKDDRRSFFHTFADAAVDMGAQRDELLIVAEAAVDMYEELEKLDLDLPDLQRGWLSGRKAYAVRALARIKADWPNAYFTTPPHVIRNPKGDDDA